MFHLGVVRYTYLYLVYFSPICPGMDHVMMSLHHRLVAMYVGTSARHPLQKRDTVDGYVARGGKGTRKGDEGQREGQGNGQGNG